MPAGLLDPQESPTQCAIRELLEETGYVATSASCGPIFYNDPGFCDTNMQIVAVDIDLEDPRNIDLKPQREANEFIESFTVPLKSFAAELKVLEAKGFKLDARVQNLAAGLELANKYGL